MAEATTRVFLALWPGPEVAARLHQISLEAEKRCGGRCMRSDTLHITLAFLGEVAESRLPLIGEAMATLQAGRFRLRIDTSGYWAHNRIVWAGCRAWPEQLDALVGDMRRALADVGLPVAAENAFFPHVTLLRKAHAVEALADFEPIDWPVGEWVLVASCPSSEGAGYRRLAGWPLA